MQKNMVPYTKDGGVKFINANNSDLVSALVAAGWVPEGQETADKDEFEADIDVLRAEAKALGLAVHHKAGVAKIAEMIKEAKGE